MALCYRACYGSVNNIPSQVIPIGTRGGGAVSYLERRKGGGVGVGMKLAPLSLFFKNGHNIVTKMFC